MDIETSEGVRCRSSVGDRPSFEVGLLYPLQSYDNNSSESSIQSSAIAGMHFRVPFGGPKQGDCSKIKKLEENSIRLKRAQELFDAGLLTAAQMKELGRQMAVDLGL